MNKYARRTYAADPSHYWTIQEIQRANDGAGHHFFSPGALRFFRSRIHDAVYQGPGGIYFVTSEQNSGPGYSGPPLFTVRRFDPETGHICRAGAFQRHGTRGEAHARAARLSEGRED